MIEEKKLDEIVCAMHTNLSLWNHTVDHGIEVLEANYQIMLKLAESSDWIYSQVQQKSIQEIFEKIKEISICIMTEKAETLEQIKKTNHSNKIANEYVKGFSNPYFIDKDF